LPRMPFEGHTKPGFVYQTLLIEPPVFLARLEADLRASHVNFVSKQFAGKADILASVPEKIVVNCTGLGSGMLFSDTKMTPIKGQLAMLPPQPALQYLYGQDGYMFPRSDHVVIGGTFEVGVCNEIPDKIVCQKLIDHMKSLFGKGPVIPMPDIHIHHPDHAPIVNPAAVPVA
jgi:D-amino-acid oxidase